MRAITYVVGRTDEESEAQQELCRQACFEHGWAILEQMVGYARNLRFDLDQVMLKPETMRVDVLVIPDIATLAHSVVGSSFESKSTGTGVHQRAMAKNITSLDNVLARLTEKGMILHFAAEGTTWDPEVFRPKLGEFIPDLIKMAQDFDRTNSERIRTGMREAKDSGRQIGRPRASGKTENCDSEGP